MHGGDIYRNRVNMDFSINVNPLGMPEEVKEALHKAVEDCGSYPDIRQEKLKRAVSRMLQMPEEYLLFGNGASELFMAIVQGIRPERTVIPVPSFYGYEYAAKAAEGEIIFYEMQEDMGFLPGEDLFSLLTGETKLLFLANPNNPTGSLMDRKFMEKLLVHCQKKGIYVVLDECFVEFCPKAHSMLEKAGQFDNLLLVRAFTKSFGIPGVRLGYLVCSNRALLSKIRRQLPEWNLSAFAQAAGTVCARQQDFLERTRLYVERERHFLEEGLKHLSITVVSGEANFLLVHSEKDLYGELLKRGILIRDCGNFRGMAKGFYRIAVKTGKENEELLKVMGEIYWEN